MQRLKIREPFAPSFRPLAHPAVRLLVEVTVLLALWGGLWLVVWGGVLRPLAQATGAYGAQSAAVRAEIVR
jgi:hypothetical protein